MSYSILHKQPQSMTVAYPPTASNHPNSTLDKIGQDSMHKIIN